MAGEQAPARGLAAGVGMLAGTAWQLQQPALWPTPVQAAMLVAGLLLLGALAWRRRPNDAVAGPPWRWAPLVAAGLAAVAAAVAAFGLTGLRAQARLAGHLPPALEGQDLDVVGVVVRLPQSNLLGTRFVFEIESARHRGQPVQVPQRVMLGWYRGPDADALLLGAPEDLRAGQRWRFTARLRHPHGALNPHGFDAELWLFEQGIRASGTVRSRPGAVAAKLGDAACCPVERLRQRVRERIDAGVDEAGAAGVIAALAIGDQGAIDRADWELFRVTGVAHLMSISGLHVTMFAWLAALVVGRLWRGSARLSMGLPAPVAARWGGLACAAGYALLAGWGVPAQRTVGMIAVVAVLRGSGWRWPAPLVLLAAAVAVVAADPWAMLQPGFWLSFVAVGLLMVAEPGRRAVAAGIGWHPRALATLREMLRTQALATVGLAPLTLVFFQQLSLVGFGANLLAIPLVTLLVTPLALLGILFAPLWQAAALLVQGLMAALSWLGALPLAVFATAAAPTWAMVAGLAGGGLLVMPLPWRLRLLGLPLVLPLLWPPVERPAPGRFELVALDVGQGTAALVRTRHHLLVYDTGPQYSPESDAGARVLLPLLRARGEGQVDLLMLSHRDSDHVGGAASLLTRWPVAEVSSSIADDHPLRTIGRARQSRCRAGQRWSWDGVQFEVLHPSANDESPPARPNAVSCVLRVQGDNGSVLLTGDIERAQEAALLARSGAALASGVLLVPHHGSRTSSSEAFIAAVAPREALVQAGYRSRFGHPAPDVLARYTALGVPVLRSDRCGAWTLAADGSSSCRRRVAARYWHHAPAGEQ